jgi:hypothetical protein
MLVLMCVFISQAPYPLGCLSPNKEFSTDAGEPSQQYLQGHGDKLHDNDSEQGEYSRLTTQTSSETSSLTSLHSSLGEHHKENNTSHEVSVKSENLIEVKDNLSGVKRKLSESDMSDTVCYLSLILICRRRRRCPLSLTIDH